MNPASRPLLQVENLGVRFDAVEVVRGASFSVAAGEMVALVGESGCGKSTAALAVLDLLPEGGCRSRGRVEIAGLGDPATDDSQHRRRLRGRIVGLVPQDAASALNPVLTLGQQLVETLRAVRGLGRRAAHQEAAALLERVAMPDARKRLASYAHQLSGGQQQRAVLALALASGPRLLLADEPTAALDVTLQAQILALLDRLRRELGLAVLLITHDLSVVASTCERVLVMYAGQVVEEAPIAALFAHPAHPYTEALLRSRPILGASALAAGIEGSVPEPGALPAGCAFAPRCRHAQARCRETPPWIALGNGRYSRCVRHAPLGTRA